MNVGRQRKKCRQNAVNYFGFETVKILYVDLNGETKKITIPEEMTPEICDVFLDGQRLKKDVHFRIEGQSIILDYIPKADSHLKVIQA